ncbi:avidin/streptavidin family protein [Fretibacter rubidus]|uniref:avidin/streptavidin family protein n=1 Tax=Fretibacter rubidus TaxID=570162 RepID=UPI00352A64D3
MYMMKSILLIASLVLASCSPAQGADTPTEQSAPAIIDGLWENDRGSQVRFTALDGELSGVYKTNVGQPDKSQSFPLRGFVQGDQVSFTVNFKGYSSMTAWVGQMSEDAGGPYIQTLWHLTRDIDDANEADDLWGSITAGASTFRPVISSDEPSP